MIKEVSKPNILVINADDFISITRARPFVALPQEEIDRLHASTELFTLPEDQAKHDPSVMQLTVLPIVHFNYSWVTLTPETTSAEKTRSLGIPACIPSEHESILFLDDELTEEAERTIRNRIRFDAGYTLRLAGILYDDSTAQSSSHPALVYVVRLHQAESIALANDGYSLSWCGTGELLLNRQAFDSASKIIIEHITAL